MKPKRQDAQTEYLKAKLTLGHVLINQADGIVYLRKNKQVKINIGKTRKGKDFKFSSPMYWRVCTPFEAFLVKSYLYKLFKVTFRKGK